MFGKKLNIKESVTPNVEKKEETPVLIKDRKKIGAEKLERYMKEELRMVKGIFQFFECPGMGTKITVRKYPGHMFEKEMQDGKEYEIPLYVARFLNGIDVTAEALNGDIGTCSYEVHSYLTDQMGNPIINRNKRKRRFGFQSLEFAGTVAA